MFNYIVPSRIVFTSSVKENLFLCSPTAFLPPLVRAAGFLTPTILRAQTPLDAMPLSPNADADSTWGSDPEGGPGPACHCPSSSPHSHGFPHALLGSIVRDKLTELRETLLTSIQNGEVPGRGQEEFRPGESVATSGSPPLSGIRTCSATREPSEPLGSGILWRLHDVGINGSVIGHG